MLASPRKKNSASKNASAGRCFPNERLHAAPQNSASFQCLLTLKRLLASTFAHHCVVCVRAEGLFLSDSSNFVFPARSAAQAVANETAALDGPSKNSKALSVREYLDTTVTPVLLKAMSELVDVRPDDPVEWLAAYLIKNNPSKVCALIRLRAAAPPPIARPPLTRRRTHRRRRPMPRLQEERRTDRRRVVPLARLVRRAIYRDFLVLWRCSRSALTLSRC